MEKGKDMEEQLPLVQTKAYSKSFAVDIANIPRGYMSIDTWIAEKDKGFIWLEDQHGLYWIAVDVYCGAPSVGEPGKLINPFVAKNMDLYVEDEPAPKHMIHPGIALSNPETATTLVEELVPVDEEGNPDESKIRSFLLSRTSANNNPEGKW